MAPWQRDRHAADGAVSTGADGKAGTTAPLPPPAAVAGALTEAAGVGAAGAGASVAGRFGFSAVSLASSSRGRFFGATAVSSRGTVVDGDAGGSGVGRGRESCPALSRALQAAPGANSEKPSRNQAQTRLSILKQSPSLERESSALAPPR